MFQILYEYLEGVLALLLLKRQCEVGFEVYFPLVSGFNWIAYGVDWLPSWRRLLKVLLLEYIVDFQVELSKERMFPDAEKFN